MQITEITDQSLVRQCLEGDQEAFGEIVRRYQTLICSIAYSATRNLNMSEEIAQETFLTAWRSLKDLRESDKLRPWLCGIVRNLSNNWNRRGKRDVLAQAGAIDQTDLTDHSVTDPTEFSIAQEEVALLDRTLETMPEQYREPLILFYREQQSVARVAELLELTSDTVKQRLTRGRKMLRDEVAAVVERGLLQSAPGRAFTIGVISALPIMSGTAKAATLTVGAAKGAGAMQAAGWAGIIGTILGPLVGLLGGWFGYSMSLKAARSPRETKLIKRLGFFSVVLCLVMTIGISLFLVFGKQIVAWNPIALAIGISGFTIAYAVAVLGLVVWANRRIAQIRQEDGTVDAPPAEMPSIIQAYQYPRVYESKTKLLGLPLISIRFQGASGIGHPGVQPARGWIAIGDKAYGVLFACGNIAIGGIAVGAVGIGLISFGGAAIGGLALGGMAVGGLSIGGSAIGWMALGGMAIAWRAAMGGMAVAHQYALGGLSIAQHANDQMAMAFFKENSFFQIGAMMLTPWAWWIMLALFLVPYFLAVRWVPRIDQTSPHSEDLPEK